MNRVKFNIIHDFYVLGVVSRFCGFKREIMRQMSIKGGDRKRLFMLGLNDADTHVDQVGADIWALRDTAPETWDAEVEPKFVSRGVRSLELSIIRAGYTESGAIFEPFESAFSRLWCPEIDREEALALYKSGQSESDAWIDIFSLLASMRESNHEF